MEGQAALASAPDDGADGSRLVEVWDHFYAYCLTIIHQTPGVRRLAPDDRDDCVQDVMVEIVRRFGERRPEEITGWIRVLSRNKAADIVRKKIRKPEVAFEDGSGRDIAGRRGSENAPMEGDVDEMGAYVAEVWEALLGLDQQVPVTSYLVFYLRTIEDWSYDEIAELFQMTPEQARARSHRVRKKFAELLKQKRDEDNPN